jgi:hypothetical protein
MAHFAKIEDGIVSQVIVVNNKAILDENRTEQESIGIDFCKSLFGPHTEWIQTSYNGNFRGKYASGGDIWDGENFISLTTTGE